MFRDENDRRDFSINASALKYGSKFILFLRKHTHKTTPKKTAAATTTNENAY